MYEIRVETEFAAAHFLKDYNGKCENLHGHNYTVLAHVRGKTLNEGGMLMDFAKLKTALRLVCSTLDHRNLNDIELFLQNPSAERIAEYIFETLLKELEKSGIDASYTQNENKPYLYAIDVFETSTSRARYTFDMN